MRACPRRSASPHLLSNRRHQVLEPEQSEDSCLPRLRAADGQAASTCGEPGESVRQQPERVVLTEGHAGEVDHDIVLPVPAGYVERRSQRRHRSYVQLAAYDNYGAVGGVLKRYVGKIGRHWFP
jgi:hypothetical protein